VRTTPAASQRPFVLTRSFFSGSQVLQVPLLLLYINSLCAPNPSMNQCFVCTQPFCESILYVHPRHARRFMCFMCFMRHSPQRYGAVWTGDNRADWGHLQARACSHYLSNLLRLLLAAHNRLVTFQCTITIATTIPNKTRRPPRPCFCRSTWPASPSAVRCCVWFMRNPCDFMRGPPDVLRSFMRNTLCA
jgi:hypothetical protein